ncbi:20747_t:CDS:2 [Dentiscutata erythropus]|uniref:20747_t:CDS:1 n=1 Tax=Dentiscutata erythropus TaxID=1348616 RepID=A0A9N9DNN9_9GLOM|nr:20747_t:CDS:2 [Dentiscutata erythropus]
MSVTKKNPDFQDAIYYVSESWDAVEDTVIINCWQEEDINELVIDLTTQDPDPEIESQLNTYLGLNDLHIITEEKLEDLEIIEILRGLNKFIGFFEQQIDEEFKAKDLKIFRKYLALVNRKYVVSKHQTSISKFFTPLNNEEGYDATL